MKTHRLGIGMKIVSMTLAGVFMLTMGVHSAFAENSTGYGDSNTTVAQGNTCGVAMENNLYVTSPLTAQGFSGSGEELHGDYTYQIQVETGQPAEWANPYYQFVTFIQNYEIVSLKVQVIWPGYRYTGPNQENLPSAYNASGDYEVFVTSYGSSGLTTEVQWAIYVDGEYQNSYSIDIPTSDTGDNGTFGYNDQTYAVAFENNLVGYPTDGGGDTLVNFLSGSGYFESEGSGTLNSPFSGCGNGSWYTDEDSNIHYASISCEYSECTQDFSVPSSGGSSDSEFAVTAVAQNGSSLSGYYTVLYNSVGTEITDGYEPYIYQGATYGDDYQVQADSYGSCTFQNWEDYSGNPATFPAQNQVLTAVYDCGGGGGSTPYIYVQSINSEGDAITGFFIQLYHSGSEIATAYTPYEFSSLGGGSTYTVYANSYGSCTFLRWENDESGGGYTVTVSESTALTLTAVYSC
jgi:hypothetical protein